jgi:holo-[acyl-carrier protein] synthase
MFGLDTRGTPALAPWLRMRLGFDLVQVSQVAQSMERFGPAYERRVFTPHERQYAHRGEGVAAERLAARLAAKEAVIKALRLGNEGVGWRDIEVRKLEDGDCEVVLHGRAAELAHRMGVVRVLLSLSHEGDYAGAFVTALMTSDAPETSAAAAP